MPRGGSRPNTGGPRVGAGRPRTRLNLDKVTAGRLKTLTLQRQMMTPNATEEMIVAELVGVAYEDFDADVQRRIDNDED